MLDRHYAPSTLTVLSNSISEDIKKYADKRIGVLVFESSIKNENIQEQIVLSKSGNLTEATSNLYDALHQLDKQNLDVIIAEIFPDFGLGKSINDRLQRATFKK